MSKAQNPPRTLHRSLALAILLVTIPLVLSSCSSSSKKPTGALKKTQYCERYREFEDKVATATDEEQLKLLQKIREAKDFPSTPSSLSDDYQRMIDGYEKALKGESIYKDEKKYEEASNRINRHAVDNCATLESDSGSSI